MAITQDLNRWQRVLLGIVIVIFAVSAFVAYGLIREMRESNQSVSYEYAARLVDADAVAIAVAARAASGRGYLLTGDPSFLESRNAARAEIGTRLDSLKREHANIDSIETLLLRQDEASDRAVKARTVSADEARAIWEREALPIQQQLETKVGELVSGERAAFATARDHAASASRHAAKLLATLLTGVAALLILLLYGYARVTRALLARQKAEQEQATFRILEQMPVGIFVLTAAGKPYYANEHAKKLLGRGILSSTVEKLPEAYEAYEAGTERLYPADRLPIVRALSGEVSECTDMEIRRGEETVPLHVVGAPVHDAQGDLMYAVAGFQDVRELQRVAMRDALTGLANRRAITQIYARERSVSTRARRPLSVALIDLDKFKSVNDTHGHASGDDVLKKTASTFLSSMRRSDAVGRWGGEELIVLLPNTDAAGAALAIEKVLGDVRALSFVGKDSASFSVTFSAGVVLAGADETLEDAVARADKLLYEAKQAGRNRVLC